MLAIFHRDLCQIAMGINRLDRRRWNSPLSQEFLERISESTATVTPEDGRPELFRGCRSGFDGGRRKIAGLGLILKPLWTVSPIAERLSSRVPAAAQRNRSAPSQAVRLAFSVAKFKIPLDFQRTMIAYCDLRRSHRFSPIPRNRLFQQNVSSRFRHTLDLAAAIVKSAIGRHDARRQKGKQLRGGTSTASRGCRQVERL